MNAAARSRGAAGARERRAWAPSGGRRERGERGASAGAGSRSIVAHRRSGPSDCGEDRRPTRAAAEVGVRLRPARARAAHPRTHAFTSENWSDDHPSQVAGPERAASPLRARGRSSAHCSERARQGHRGRRAGRRGRRSQLDRDRPPRPDETTRIRRAAAPTMRMLVQRQPEQRVRLLDQLRRHGLRDDPGRRREEERGDDAVQRGEHESCQSSRCR